MIKLILLTTLINANISEPWGTYSNSSYRYSVDLPASWKLLTFSEEYTVLAPDNYRTEGPMIEILTFNDSDEGINFFNNFYYENFVLEEWKENMTRASYQSTKFAGTNSLRFFISQKWADVELHKEITFFKRNENIFMIQKTNYSANKNCSSTKLDGILKSFELD